MIPALQVLVLILAALALLWLTRAAPSRVIDALAAGPVRVAGTPVGPPAGARAAGHGRLDRARGIIRRARRARSEPAEWVDWIRQLAALVRAGQSPASIFALSAETAAEAPAPGPALRRQEEVCRAVAAGAGIGRSPSASLRHAGEVSCTRRGRGARLEAAVLLDLSRCWEVSERTGAPLAALLDGLAEATEGDLDAAAARETALAGARATVRILSWLPVVALGLGFLVGADPLRTLLTTPWGMAAALAGAVLTVVGRVWTQRMVRAAESAVAHRPAGPAGPPRTRWSPRSGPSMTARGHRGDRGEVRS